MENFDELSTKIRELSLASPEKLSDHLNNSVGHIKDIAPSIAPQMQATYLNGLNFLESKLPKPQQEYMGGNDWKPSKSQLHEFDVYHKMVKDPLSILDHVKNGTLTKQHIETIQAVYPALLKNIQNKIAEQLSDKTLKKIPYKTKISLTKFLGVPLDATLQPQSMLNNQMNFIAKNMASQTQLGKTKTSQGGLKALKIGDREATETQRQDKLKN